MYDRNVAVTGCTIEKTSRYDRFRENNIRMELYRIILHFMMKDTACFPAI